MTVQTDDTDLHPGIEPLKALVHKILEPQMDGRPFRVSIHTFGEGSGIRVAEVDYFVPRPDNERLGAGGTWMRSDPACAPVILAAEEFLLWHDEPVQVYDGWHSDIVDGVEGPRQYNPSLVDMAQETEIRLWQALTEGTGTPLPPWEDRWPVGVTVPDATVWYDPVKKAAYDKARR